MTSASKNNFLAAHWQLASVIPKAINSMGSAPPTKATDAVLVASEPVPEGVQQVQGIDWSSLPAEQRTIISNFVDQLTGQGFQSSSIGDAIRIINNMVGLFSNIYLYQVGLTTSSDRGKIPRRVRRRLSSWVTPPI
jgi:deoxyhypusine synthase